MKTVLKRKMDNFFESISEKEKKRNKKLAQQIEFLKKYLGTLGDGSAGKFEDSENNLQKYFNFELKGVRI
jgi:hypothetical protein